MALDASIFARFQPKSVAEFDNEYAVAENAKADRQANALKLLGAQRGEEIAKQDYADSNALRDIYKTNQGADANTLMQKVDALGNQKLS